VENNNQLLQLYPKLLSGNISEQELNLLTEYFDNGDQQQLIELIRAQLDLSEQNSEPAPNESVAVQQVYKNLNQQLGLSKVDTKQSTRKLWPRLMVAAAVGIIIVSSVVWFYRINPVEKQTDPLVNNDVAPGRQGATLTLDNGKKIFLNGTDSGEVARESGVTISKTAGGVLIYEIMDTGKETNETNILSTDKGETFQVKLPDGSSVWLNAASTLKYPASFGKLKNRTVMLSGEGYFEIAKDKAHPFIVKTDQQQVEVRGTNFNINAYNDEPVVATTLLEGSIKVSSPTESRIITPGQQIINNGHILNTVQVDTESIIDWKEGDFALSDLNFKTAMRKISRWYDIEVIYDSSVPKELETGGWISRNTKLSEVLSLIEKSGLAEFRLEGKKLYVSKKKKQMN